MANVAVRSVDTAGTVDAAAIIPMITRSRPPEQASSTLKQNAALLERLRQVAMRSDPPPSSAIIEVIAPSAPAKEPTVHEENTVKNLAATAVAAEESKPLDAVGKETARAFLLVTPAVEVPVSRGAVVEPATPSASAEREEPEPTTNMQPSVMRARERAAHEPISARPEPVGAKPEPISAKQRLASPDPSIRPAARRSSPAAFVVAVGILMLGAGTAAYHFAQQHAQSGATNASASAAMGTP